MKGMRVRCVYDANQPITQNTTLPTNGVLSVDVATVRKTMHTSINVNDLYAMI